MSGEVASRGGQSQTVIARVKEAVRARDGYRCAQCGLSQADHVARVGRRLEVHRITPGSLYSLEGCVTLCRDCHASRPRRDSGQPDFAHGDRLPCLTRLPGPWYLIAQQLAKRRPTPVLWYIIELIKKDAEANGAGPLPPAPWEQPDRPRKPPKKEKK